MKMDIHVVLEIVLLQKIAIKVDVVDMEAYALAKVCKLENINFRCFKFISDNADETAS